MWCFLKSKKILVLTFCLGLCKKGAAFPKGEWGRDHDLEGGGCDVLHLGHDLAHGADEGPPEEQGQALHRGVPHCSLGSESRGPLPATCRSMEHSCIRAAGDIQSLLGHESEIAWALSALTLIDPLRSLF